MKFKNSFFTKLGLQYFEDGFGIHPVTLMKAKERLVGLRGSVALLQVALALDLLLDLHEAFEQSFGTRGTAGDVDVDRDDLIHTLTNGVGVLEESSAV
jgi:hypothetical protein